jgi:hypothetical protein
VNARAIVNTLLDGVDDPTPQNVNRLLASTVHLSTLYDEITKALALKNPSCDLWDDDTVAILGYSGLAHANDFKAIVLRILDKYGIRPTRCEFDNNDGEVTLFLPLRHFIIPVEEDEGNRPA